MYARKFGGKKNPEIPKCMGFLYQKKKHKKKKIPEQLPNKFLVKQYKELKCAIVLLTQPLYIIYYSFPSAKVLVKDQVGYIELIE